MSEVPPYDTVVDALVDTAVVGLSVIRHPSVAANWERPSALPRWNVGGLAGHLALVVRRVVKRLDDPAPTVTSPTKPRADPPHPPPPFSYGATRVGSPSELSSPQHVRIRQDGDHVARYGPASLADRLEEHIAVLTERLPNEDPERALSGGPLPSASMRLHEYLVTRVVEVVVHTDDLAASISIEAALPVTAVTIAADFLLAAARAERGDLTVVRALARAERASLNELRVL